MSVVAVAVAVAMADKQAVVDPVMLRSQAGREGLVAGSAAAGAGLAEAEAEAAGQGSVSVMANTPAEKC